MRSSTPTRGTGGTDIPADVARSVTKACTCRDLLQARPVRRPNGPSAGTDAPRDQPRSVRLECRTASRRALANGRDGVRPKRLPLGPGPAQRSLGSARLRHQRRLCRRRGRTDDPLSGCGRRPGRCGLRLDSRLARPALPLGDDLRDGVPRLARLQPSRQARSGRRLEAGAQHLQLGGHAVLRRHRLRTSLLVHGRVGRLYGPAAVRRRTGQSPGTGMGRHLRHLPLGTVGVVPLLPADGGHCLALLPLSTAVSSAFRRPSRTLRPRVFESAMGPGRRPPLHPGADRRHRDIARSRHPHAWRGGRQAVRRRGVVRDHARDRGRLRRLVRGQRLPGSGARHSPPFEPQSGTRRRLPRLGASHRTGHLRLGTRHVRHRPDAAGVRAHEHLDGPDPRNRLHGGLDGFLLGVVDRLRTVHGSFRDQDLARANVAGADLRHDWLRLARLRGFLRDLGQQRDVDGPQPGHRLPRAVAQRRRRGGDRGRRRQSRRANRCRSPSFWCLAWSSSRRPTIPPRMPSRHRQRETSTPARTRGARTACSGRSRWRSSLSRWCSSTP